MLREKKVLTSLGLLDCGLGPKGLCKVCNAVGMNTTLTSLHLSFNKFDDPSIASLGKLLITSSVTCTFTSANEAYLWYFVFHY